MIMKMKLSMTLSLLASITILSSCGGTTGGTTDDLETIGKAMEAGKSMKCNVSMTDENAPAMNMIYYVDGDNVRVESSFNGQSMIAIQKGKDSYMEPSSMMGETDCDWLVMTQEEEVEEAGAPDFDYKQFEADPNYKMECTFGSVDSKLFETSGKTCTTEEVMQGMMGGMDLGDIDMEQFQ